jgi:sodium-dependent phosphate cotransporter
LAESTTKEKVLRVLFYILAPMVVLGMLYLFICSLDMLTSAFKLLTG